MRQMSKWESSIPTLSALRLTSLFKQNVKSGLISYINAVGPDLIIEHLPPSITEEIRTHVLKTSPKSTLVDMIMNLESNNAQLQLESTTVKPSSENTSTTIVSTTPEVEHVIDSILPSLSSDTTSNTTTSRDVHVTADLLDIQHGLILQERRQIKFSKKTVQSYWGSDRHAFIRKVLQIRTPFPKICTCLDCELCLSFLYSLPITGCDSKCEGRHVFDSNTVIYPHLTPTLKKKLNSLHSFDIRQRPVITPLGDMGSVARFVLEEEGFVEEYRNHRVSATIDLVEKLVDGKEYLYTDTDEDNKSGLSAEFPAVKKKRSPQGPDIVSSNSSAILARTKRRKH